MKHHHFHRQILLMLTVSLLGGCATRLDKAVESGDLEATKREIAKGGNVNPSEMFSLYFPMERAIHNDDLAMVKLLHTNGATIDRFYLSAAAANGGPSTFEYLLENGAHLYDSCSSSMMTITSDIGPVLPPLGFALGVGDLVAVKKLLELGAPIQSKCTTRGGKHFITIYCSPRPSSKTQI